ncbi:SGK307 [Mytilus edulis]|uniref:TEX14 n=1 Tax=Mytilus edulis TaxID=6550 RepID=A0A8S3STJ1_MYTED|nr:SGK307 [Mytilus edulis]
MEGILKLGSVEPGDKLGWDFHQAARNGNKRRLRKIIDKGIHVDYPNSLGQSPLFCACYLDEEAVVKELMKFGANPNERSNNGMTPVHVVAYTCNLNIMNELLAAGGDLRLHDSTGRSSKEFAFLQPEQKKRMKMLEFLEKTRLFALTKSGRDLRASLNGPRHNHRITSRTSSVIKLIRDKITGYSNVNLDHQMKSCQSMGFGKVYQDGDSFSGIICTLPLVSENLLKHDSHGLSFNNGAFMVMESMIWKNTIITVKIDYTEWLCGYKIDLLITEAEYIGEKVDVGLKSFVNQNMYQNVAYNWMAPEIMNASSPSMASDVYSFAVVIWEMFHGEVPWGKLDTETVHYKILKEREQLEIETDRIPEAFMLILKHCLQLDPLHRKLQMYNIRNILTIPKQNVLQYMESLLKIEEEKKPSKLNTPRDQRHINSPSPKRHDRSISKSPRAESTPRRLLDDDHHKEMRFNNNQSSKLPISPDYLQDDRLRFVDRMKFNHKDLDWELKEEQQGKDYYYTVRVNKDDEQKFTLPLNKEDEQKFIAPSEQSESEAGSSVSEHVNHGNRSLATKFSYLKVQQQCLSPPGKCVKPASHCIDPKLECAPEKKLSTAGSVYALYNMDYHTPQKITQDPRTPLYNTMPRKRQKMSVQTPENTELGPSVKDWYGGNGSVKDLVNLYQKQVNEHSFQQDLLKGKLSTVDIGLHHQVQSIYPNIQNISPCYSPENCNNQGLRVSKEPSQSDLSPIDSLTTVSPEDCKDKKDSSGPDSDEVSDWIDNELFRIQSTLSQEVFEALDEKKQENMSPLLFDDERITPSTSQKKPKSKKKIQNKKKLQYDVEEFYIDDEINPDTHKLSHKPPEYRSTSSKKKHPDYIKPLRDQYHKSEDKRVVEIKQKSASLKDDFYSKEKKRISKQSENQDWQSYNDSYNPNYSKREEFFRQNTHRQPEYKHKQYDSDISSDSMKLENSRNKQLKKLHTSFHSVPQCYNESGDAKTYSQEIDEDTYPRIIAVTSETDQQKLKNKVDERAAFASTVIVETSTIYPDQHRVTHTLTDLADGTTSTLYGKNVKASRLLSAMITQ